MKNKIKTIMLALLIAPTFSFGQYFQGLYDADTSQDWGIDVFVQSDNSYLIFGTPFLVLPYRWGLFNMNVSADGSIVENMNLLHSDIFNLRIGYPGATKALSGGGYISPISGQNYSVTNTWGGLVKYDAAGNVVFIKTFTDTPLYYDGMLACAVMPDGGYIVGGEHLITTSAYPNGYIVRMDSLGDSLWTHVYEFAPNEDAQVNDIIPLPDGRIVAGASTDGVQWYMLLDSRGNIIRDTLYNSGQWLGAFIYADMSGGYICQGGLNITYSSNPDDFRNYPAYIAHLDTNFAITWMKEFPYYADSGARQPWYVKQLRDSSYVVVGEMWPNNIGVLGWAAKLDKNGQQIWSQTYLSDTNNFARFRGVAEKPDGSLVMTGEAFNDTLPSWWQGYSVWLVGTDSNGCQNAFCAPEQVKPLTPKGAFSLYPNPTTGNFTINAPEAGALEVYNIQGQQVAAYKITQTETTLQLPGGTAAGVYFVKYISGEGNNAPVVVRLIKE